jgi:hypothetical protein
MPDDLTTLLAVLVGGLLSYVVQARLDERKGLREFDRDQAAAERERERERAVESADLRVATRLLLDEIDTLALHHAMLALERRYPQKLSSERQRYLFPTNVWETYKPALARGFEDEWDALTPFMHTIPRVRAIVLEAEPESAIEAEMVERLRDGALFARELYEALAGTPAPSVNEKGEPTGA